MYDDVIDLAANIYIHTFDRFCLRFIYTNRTGGHQPHADSSPGVTFPFLLTSADRGLYSGVFMGPLAPLGAGTRATATWVLV